MVFRKTLSNNDVGQTSGHQAGVLIPKGQKELLSFLPQLDKTKKNPDAWINFLDDNKDVVKFRFIHYNNKLHEINGTRDEYRLTHMTAWLKNQGAKSGDELEISGPEDGSKYQIKLLRKTGSDLFDNDGKPKPIKLKGWHRVH